MNKKDIILQIQKMAANNFVKQSDVAAPPPIPGAKAPATDSGVSVGPVGVTSPPALPGTVAPTAPASVPAGGYVQKGNPEVINMQKAIQAFADTAVDYKTDTVKDPKDPTGKKLVKVVRPTDKRKDFNDFLTEQYSANSASKGDEYTTDATKTKMEEKQPTELIEMDNAIDGLRRIGPGADEMKADGNWGERTNNATKNTYAFADALVRIADDFGGLVPIFKKNDLKAMKDNLFPDSVVSPIKEGIKAEELKKRSQALTPLIKKLKDFYNQYSDHILTHPKYVSYIEKNSPLLKVAPGGTDPGELTAEQQAAMKQPPTLSYPMNLPGKKGPVAIKGLTTAYLKDMESFRNFMWEKLGYSPEDTNDFKLQKLVLDALNQHVYESLATMSAPPVAKPV